MDVKIDDVTFRSSRRKISKPNSHSHNFETEHSNRSEVVVAKDFFLCCCRCYETMVFGCFYPITGGRVGEIISQESKWCKDKDALPLSRNEDKFEKFCETYKDFTNVVGVYKTFLGHWEKQKSAAGEALLKVCQHVCSCDHH
jgi:hypothetical protein